MDAGIRQEAQERKKQDAQDEKDGVKMKR